LYFWQSSTRKLMMLSCFCNWKARSLSSSSSNCSLGSTSSSMSLT
jgi:hypothetical protein